MSPIERSPHPATFPCPEDGCGSLLERRYSPRFERWFYGCRRWPDCKGSLGCHPDGRPIGTPANERTREKRIEAHAVFDRLWRGTGAPMRRRKAYRWISRKLKREVHIGESTFEQCEEIIRTVREAFPDLFRGDQKR